MQKMPQLLINLIFFIIIPFSLFSQNYSAKLIKIITKDDTGRRLKAPTFARFNFTTNRLMLIDAAKSRIILYNESFFPVFSIGTGRGLKKPVACDFYKKDIYVLLQKNLNKKYSEIKVYSSAWREKRKIILKGFKGDEKFFPFSLAVNKYNGKIYTAGTGVDGILIFTNKGRYLKKILIKDKFSENEKEEEEIVATFSDLYIDESQRLYALSENLGRVYVFSKYDNLLFKASQKGGTRGKLSRPRGVTASLKLNMIFIVDYMRQIVQCLDYKTGKFLFEFGGYGTFPGKFNYPTKITIDENNFLYITDLFNQRVQVFEITKN